MLQGLLNFQLMLDVKFCRIIIKNNKIVDFETNISVKRAVLIEIEDFLLDDLDVDIAPQQAEIIAQKCWELAVENRDNI